MISERNDWIEEMQKATNLTMVTDPKKCLAFNDWLNKVVREYYDRGYKRCKMDIKLLTGKDIE
jgi:hypothetical protein